MPTLSASMFRIVCCDSPQDMHKDIEASVTSLMKAHSGAQLFVSGHSLVCPFVFMLTPIMYVSRAVLSLQSALSI